MYIRISGVHKQALDLLAEQEGIPTNVAMVRNLIRDAAQARNLWPPEEKETETPTKQAEAATA